MKVLFWNKYALVWLAQCQLQANNSFPSVSALAEAFFNYFFSPSDDLLVFQPSDENNKKIP